MSHIHISNYAHKSNPYTCVQTINVWIHMTMRSIDNFSACMLHVCCSEVVGDFYRICRNDLVPIKVAIYTQGSMSPMQSEIILLYSCIS